MADYNIYIHAFSGESSATTPFQLKEGGGEGGNAGGFQNFAQKASAFLQDPDSAIGNVTSTAAGAVSRSIPWVAAAVLAIKVGTGIADKVITTYHSFIDSRTGEYGFSIKYNNAKTALRNVLRPISTVLSIEEKRNQEIIENANNEQERFMFGGTIYNSRYGRYL